MQRTKRIIAILLVAVSLVGYLPAITGTAAKQYPTPSEGAANLLTAYDHNFNFEVAEAEGSTAPKGWHELAAKDWASFELVERSAGNKALKYSATAGGSGSHFIYSEPINVESLVGKKLIMNLDIKGSTDKPQIQAYVYFYADTTTPTSFGSGAGIDGSGTFNAGSLGTVEWQTVSQCMQYTPNPILVPEGAKYARVFFNKVASGVGDVYIDNVTLKPICDAHTYNKGNASTLVYEETSCQTRYYKRCDNCDYFRYVPNVGVEYGTVWGAPDHDLKAIPAKTATETTPGNIAYWVCNDCDRYFADANGASEITNKDSVILGKRYTNLLEPYNYSFEDTAVGADPADWATYDSGDKYHEVTDKEAQHGTKSLKLFTDETAKSPKGIYTPYYTIASYMKKMSVLLYINGDSDAYIYMYFYDANKQRIANVEGEPLQYRATPMNGWTLAYGTYSVPEGAVYGRVMVYKPHTEMGTVYIDNIVVKEYQNTDGPQTPTELHEDFENGSAKNGLPWGWSFYNEATNPSNGTYYAEIIDVADAKLPASASKEAPDGKHVLKFYQPGTDEKLRGIYSPYIDVSDMDAVALTMDFVGEGAVQAYIMFSDENYKCKEDSDHRPWVMDDYFSDWGQMNFEVSVPKDAKYARVLIVKSYRAPYPGEVYIDKVILKEIPALDNAEQAPPAPEIIEYDWQIKETEHPRVYFTATELRRLKKWARNESLTSMGYSGKDAYDELIAAADGYLGETYFRVAFAGQTIIDTPLYPVLEDMSVHPAFDKPPAPNYADPYPYMTNITNNLMLRMKTLALAYAISGDVKYGERAVQYAADMSKWQHWAGYHEVISRPNQWNELYAQSTGYCIMSVSTVYDMCFDLLTDSQKKLMEDALIKNMEHGYNTAITKMGRGRDGDTQAALYYGACAIINEENKDVVGKYLDVTIAFTNWMFDWYDAGHNEGYDYACHGIDFFVGGMAVTERVTGKAASLDHHFFTETLPAWVKGFLESGTGTMPGYSDSPYAHEFLISLATMAKRGDTDAGYCLSIMGGADTAFDKLIYTNISDDYIWPSEEDYMNVTVVDVMGVGSLRTGWDPMDKLLVMISDNYPCGHAHWESNAIWMAMNGRWLIRDPGYGSIQAGVPKTAYDMQYAANVIFVDNKPQTVKAAGKISKIVDSELDGHILGQAPGAYGKYDGVPVVDKFDRHTIMMNHDSESYYIVFDDLASSQEHVYGWNMVHSAWDRLEIDGEVFDTSTTVKGNHMALLRYDMVLHTHFVGEALEFSAPYYTKAGQSYGPLLRANAESAKEYQFMTIISVDEVYAGIITIDSLPLLKAWTNKQTNDNPDGFSWSSTNDSGSGIARPLRPDGYDGVMFRAGSIGDWMSFAFTVEETGEYNLSLKLGAFTQYAGAWQAYLDGEPIGEIYRPKSNRNAMILVPMEKVTLTAGKHTIKMELVGEPETEDLDWGTLISMGQVILGQEGVGMGMGPTEVLETYDDENVLGATIKYGTVLSDIVLFNRGTGTISGGGLTSDGEQARVLGQYQGEIKEGFTVVNGTSASYNGQTLLTADGKVTVAVDYHLARIPVKNTPDNVEDEEDEDFNIKKPITKLSTNAIELRKITIYVGNDAPFTVTMDDGEIVESTYANGMLTLDVPAGQHKFEIRGTHCCVFDQRVTMIPNVKSWATCTEGAWYYVSCYCGANGTEFFQEGDPKGHYIVWVEAKEATETEDGCNAHFECKECGAFFADAEGKQPLDASAVIIPQLVQPTNLTWLIWVGVGVGGLAIIAVAALLILKFKFGIVLFGKKKEAVGETPDETPDAEQEV